MASNSSSGESVTSVDVGNDQVMAHVARGSVSPGPEPVRPGKRE